MKKIIIVFLIAFLFITTVDAQDKVTNVITYGENIETLEGIEVTEDGYLVVGSLNDDFVLIKYNLNNEVVWTKTYGGTGSDHLYDIEKTSDGYVATGYSSSTDITSVTNKGNKDAIVLKIDNFGNLKWIRNYGGASDDELYDIEVLNDGSYISVGYTSSKNLEGIESSSYEDGLIINYDKDGNLKYVKLLAGDFTDIYRGATSTKDGGYLVVGSSLSADIGFTPNVIGDGILFKYDKDGNVVWKQKTEINTEPIFGTNFGISFDKNPDLGFYDVIETSDGSFIAVGTLQENQATFTPGTFSGNVALTFPSILKYDSNGIYKWGKTYNASGTYYDVEEGNDGSYWAVGNYENTNAIIMKYDKDGNTTISFGGTASSNILNLNNVEMIYDNYIASVGKYSGNSVTFTIGGIAEPSDKTFKKDESLKGKYDSFVYTVEEQYDMIDISNTDKGTIELSTEKGKGIINISPNPGYKVDEIQITDSKDNEVSYIDNKDGPYKINLIDSVNIAVTYREVIIKIDETLEDTSFFEVSKTEDNKGKIKINLEKGYQVNTISIKDSNGNEVEYERKNDGYYFDLKDDIIVSITKELIPDNPKTGQSNYILVFLPSIAMCLLTYYFIKKNENYYNL